MTSFRNVFNHLPRCLRFYLLEHSPRLRMCQQLGTLNKALPLWEWKAYPLLWRSQWRERIAKYNKGQ